MVDNNNGNASDDVNENGKDAWTQVREALEWALKSWKIAGAIAAVGAAGVTIGLQLERSHGSRLDRGAIQQEVDQRALLRAIEGLDATLSGVIKSENGRARHDIERVVSRILNQELFDLRRDLLDYGREELAAHRAEELISQRLAVYEALSYRHRIMACDEIPEDVLIALERAPLVFRDNPEVAEMYNRLVENRGNGDMADQIENFQSMIRTMSGIAGAHGVPTGLRAPSNQITCAY